VVILIFLLVFVFFLGLIVMALLYLVVGKDFPEVFI
jgi:hypothetical protein